MHEWDIRTKSGIYLFISYVMALFTLAGIFVVVYFPFPIQQEEIALNIEYELGQTNNFVPFRSIFGYIKDFFSGIKNFAFFPMLDKTCKKVMDKTVDELIVSGKYPDVVKMLIESDGMNYGNLPKAVLEFHRSSDKVNTALEEHLEEGAQYARNKSDEVKVHFTVSPEHRKEFEKIINTEIPHLKELYNVNYNVEMSEQKPSTDTIAVNPDNSPFRENGSLFFRPAGHGALLENLNDLDADVVFIKNIDNVVPRSRREITIRYKKVIGGYLVTMQKQIAKYIGQLESGNYNMDDVREMISFLHNKLNIRNSETKHLEDCELVLYILKKLNRPIRVCGVVKNDGEPGGGPYIVYSEDKTTSPQILESSQFDKNDPESKELIRTGSHFNPVDLVCYIKDKDGNKFNLKKFVDKNTGFISEKSRDGKTLKALELPGLWNGSMSDWNTVFVEVPIETFNPVKTVNDLLRPQHQ